MKNHIVFDVFRKWSFRWHFLMMKKRSVFEVSGGLKVNKCSVFGVFCNLFIRGGPKSAKDRFWEGLGTL